jgi:hypothetical protein
MPLVSKKIVRYVLSSAHPFLTAILLASSLGSPPRPVAPRTSAPAASRCTSARHVGSPLAHGEEARTQAGTVAALALLGVEETRAAAGTAATPALLGAWRLRRPGRWQAQRGHPFGPSIAPRPGVLPRCLVVSFSNAPSVSHGTSSRSSCHHAAAF